MEKLEIKGGGLSLKGTHGEVLIEGEYRRFICNTGFGKVYSPDGYEFTSEVQEALLERTKKAESKIFT